MKWMTYLLIQPISQSPAHHHCCRRRRLRRLRRPRSSRSSWGNCLAMPTRPLFVALSMMICKNEMICTFVLYTCTVVCLYEESINYFYNKFSKSSSWQCSRTFFFLLLINYICHYLCWFWFYFFLFFFFKFDNSSIFKNNANKMNCCLMFDVFNKNSKHFHLIFVLFSCCFFQKLSNHRPNGSSKYW